VIISGESFIAKKIAPRLGLKGMVLRDIYESIT